MVIGVYGILCGMIAQVRVAARQVSSSTKSRVVSGSPAILQRRPGKVSHVATIRHSRLKLEFLRSLQTDLRRVGISLSLNRASKYVKLRLLLKPVPEDRKIRLMREEQVHRFGSAAPFLKKLISEGVENQFVDGIHLNCGSIKPRIEFCKSREDHELLKFCRLLQSVPASRLLYRQIAALVKDD